MKQLTHGGDIYSKRDIKENAKLIDFSANVNPLGMPLSVKRTIIDNVDLFSNYPDPLCRDLINEISIHENVPKEYIVCGNGAADIIYRIAATLRPKIALLPAPTFSEYEQSLRAVNCSIRYHYLLEKEGFVLDESILEKLSTDVEIAFLCNPNNPTGISINKDIVIKIASLCKKNNTVLVVDECFIDFLENSQNYSIVEELNNYNNVIVLKAFTKIYAMAGIRLGYGICSNKELIDRIYNQGQPWNVSVVAQKCGVIALKERDYVNQTKIIIKQNREYLIKNLKLVGFKVFNSEANYILFKTKNKFLQRNLEKEGILIRSCSNYIGLDDSYFRIAVKTQEENEYFIKTLKKILK